MIRSIIDMYLILPYLTTDDNVELSSSDDELINKMVNISSFTQGEGILHSFPCSEIKDDFYMPRYLDKINI